MFVSLQTKQLSFVRTQTAAMTLTNNKIFNNNPIYFKSMNYSSVYIFLFKYS